MRAVPDHIQKPDYHLTGVSKSEEESKYQRTVPRNTPQDIEGIRMACRLVRECLDMCHRMIRPGVTTEEIDVAVHNFCIERNAYPSPLNYYKFPKALCTSVNEVICHGIPDSRPLEDGDIVDCDVSIYYNGYHGDANETYLCGNVDENSKELVRTTYEALMKSIEICKPGVKYSVPGNIISDVVEAKGFSVVKSYTGHGVGKLFHCAPFVPHNRNNNAKWKMEKGHVFTIEPMINMGSWRDEH